MPNYIVLLPRRLYFSYNKMFTKISRWGMVIISSPVSFPDFCLLKNHVSRLLKEMLSSSSWSRSSALCLYSLQWSSNLVNIDIEFPYSQFPVLLNFSGRICETDFNALLVTFWVVCKKRYSFVYTFVHSKFVLWVSVLEYARENETKTKKTKPIEIWKV